MLCSSGPAVPPPHVTSKQSLARGEAHPADAARVDYGHRLCRSIVAGERLRWLVRWPPSTWNVANCRPHVRHSNASSRRGRWRRRRRLLHGGGAAVVPAASSLLLPPADEPHDRESKTSHAACSWSCSSSSPGGGLLLLSSPMAMARSSLPRFILEITLKCIGVQWHPRSLDSC
jgi:hypothetical protein